LRPRWSIGGGNCAVSQLLKSRFFYR
jgi:hypothetical protein